MTTKNKSLTLQRRQAKVGMSIALGTLVATGFMTRIKGETQTSRNLHLCAGVALVGFSYWHWTLYPDKRKSKGHHS